MRIKQSSPERVGVMVDGGENGNGSEWYVWVKVGLEK
jgi:hypothetical protein